MNELIYFFLPLTFCIIGVFLFNKISREKNFALGADINKKEQNKTPEATGIVLLILLWIIILAMNYVNGIRTEMFYWVGIISVFCLIGFADDTVTKWTNKGLGWKQRAIPIALFSVVFGLLISGNIIEGTLIGLFIAAFSSFHNTFAGLNGWEVGSSYIIALCTVFLLAGSGLFIYAVIVSALILGLLLFNLYPAKVFPGDSGTLFMGSAIAGLIALTTKKELIIVYVFFYLPHLVDFLFLKMLTNPKDPTQLKIRPYKLLENGKLDIPEYKGKTKYDFAKLIIKIFGPMKEWKIVLINWLVVGINCLIWLIVFGKISF